MVTVVAPGALMVVIIVVPGFSIVVVYVVPDFVTVFVAVKAIVKGIVWMVMTGPSSVKPRIGVI